jgi:hypothetical protein
MRKEAGIYTPPTPTSTTMLAATVITSDPVEGYETC